MSDSLRVYDPAMCCSTGVCGPSVDPRLVKLAADLAFMKFLGVTVERFNLGHQPEAFANDPLVLSGMGDEGEGLPLFVANGEIKARATYPTRLEMASWFGLEGRVAAEKPLNALKLAPGKRCC